MQIFFVIWEKFAFLLKKESYHKICQLLIGLAFSKKFRYN